MPEPAAMDARFTSDSFRFLKELAKNNNRDWFNANKTRYETSIRDPSFAFVRAVGSKLGSISSHLVADPRPVGGSIMRFYRDIRFSKDKSPYKTAIGIHFMHDGGEEKDDNLPGFFAHLAPGDSWLYAGVWQPARARLDRIRQAIVARPADWKKVRAAVPGIEGESLKRAPPGYDPAHPLVDDLKRKAFTVGKSLPDSEVTSTNFPERFVADCRSLDPLNRFLASAVGVPY